MQAEAEKARELAKKPATLEEAVQKAVAARVAAERTSFSTACSLQLSTLRQELAALQGK